MADQNLAALAQQINRFSDTASEHLNTFRQSAGEQNRSITKMIKDIAGHFTRQNGSLENISASMSDNADSINNLSRKIDNSTGIMNQSIGVQSSMLSELQNINSSIGALIKVTRQNINNNNNNTNDPKGGGLLKNLEQTLWGLGATRTAARLRMGRSWLGGPAGQALGAAGTLGKYGFMAGAGIYGGASIGQGLMGDRQTPLVSNTTTAKDLPEGASALLDTIAGRESGGDYNKINHKAFPSGLQKSGKEGEHPFKGQKGYTAAGRYQFLNNTWEETAKKAGLDPNDFSPENQDRAAWYLAKQDYKKGTKRNLEEDIKDPKMAGTILNNLGSWKEADKGVAAPAFSEKTFQQNMQKEKARREEAAVKTNEQAKTTPQAQQNQSETTKAPSAPAVKPEEGEGQGPAASATSKPQTTERQGEGKVDEKQAKEFLSSRQTGGAGFVGVNADKLNSDFAVKLTEAIQFAEKASGERIGITEGYRPPEVQAQYYANYIGKDVEWNGQKYSPQKQGGLAAPPGQSNHQKGTAVDISGGRAREILRANASRFGLKDLGSKDLPHFQLSSGENEEQISRRERPQPQQSYAFAGGGPGYHPMTPLMMGGGMRGMGGMGALGMGMMNPAMGMMMGGRMGRTGGLIGLGANILDSILSRPSREEKPTAPARMVAPSVPQPSKEIERAAVNEKVEDSSKKNQPPVVIQQGGAQQKQQPNISESARRDKVTSAANPWAMELKEYYKTSLA